MNRNVTRGNVREDTFERRCTGRRKEGREKERREGGGVEFLNVNRRKVVREWSVGGKRRACTRASGGVGCWWAGIGAFILGPRLLFFLRAVATNFPSSFCSHWAPSGECQAFPLSNAGSNVAQCRVALAAVAPETNF